MKKKKDRIDHHKLNKKILVFLIFTSQTSERKFDFENGIIVEEKRDGDMRINRFSFSSKQVQEIITQKKKKKNWRKSEKNEDCC